MLSKLLYIVVVILLTKGQCQEYKKSCNNCGSLAITVGVLRGHQFWTAAGRPQPVSQIWSTTIFCK